eukprot:4419529-Prymnesium_polylepis.1
MRAWATRVRRTQRRKRRWRSRWPTATRQRGRHRTGIPSGTRRRGRPCRLDCSSAHLPPRRAEARVPHISPSARRQAEGASRQSVLRVV